MKFYIYILFLIIFYSCSYSTSDINNNLEYLYKLRIPNSPKVLYDYSYRGSMSFSSNIRGYSLQDSSIIFRHSNINKLPHGILAKIDTDNIYLLSSLTSKDEKSTFEGFNVIRQNASYFGGSTTGTHYFKEIEESDYELIFKDIVHGSGKVIDSLVFNKCLVRIIENENGYVEEVIINESKKFDDSDRLMTYSYTLRPDSLNRKLKISDWGVFKKIK